MRSTPESITLPLVLRRAEIAPLGWMFLSIGLSLIVLAIADAGTSIALFLFNIPWALGFTGAGIQLILVCRLRLHLVPEGVAVSLFGRTLVRWPIEKLTAYSWTWTSMDNPMDKRLCLTAVSLEELAAMQERKLRGSWYYRSGVDRRKQRGNWQREFVFELLTKKSWLHYYLPIRRYGLMLENTPELRALLKKAYSGLCWEKRPYTPTPQHVQPNGKKRNIDYPGDFLRWHEGIQESAGNELLGLVMLMPMMIFMILGAFLTTLSDDLMLVCEFIALIWLFGSLAWLGRMDRVILEETGIRVRMKNRTTRVVDRGAIRTVWRFSVNSKVGWIHYLMISSCTREELVQRAEKRMAKTRRGREELSALQLLECWPELAVRRYLIRRAQFWGYWDSDFLLVGYTPERQEWILERYPELRVGMLYPEMIVPD